MVSLPTAALLAACCALPAVQSWTAANTNDVIIASSYGDYFYLNAASRASASIYQYSCYDSLGLFDNDYVPAPEVGTAWNQMTLSADGRYYMYFSDDGAYFVLNKWFSILSRINRDGNRDHMELANLQLARPRVASPDGETVYFADITVGILMVIWPSTTTTRILTAAAITVSSMLVFEGNLYVASIAPSRLARVGTLYTSGLPTSASQLVDLKGFEANSPLRRNINSFVFFSSVRLYVLDARISGRNIYDVRWDASTSTWVEQSTVLRGGGSSDTLIGITGRKNSSQSYNIYSYTATKGWLTDIVSGGSRQIAAAASGEIFIGVTTPSLGLAPSATPRTSASSTPSSTVTPTRSPSVTPSATPSRTRTKSGSKTASTSPSTSSTSSSSVTASGSRSPASTPSQSDTPLETPSITSSRSATPSESASSTLSPSITASNSATGDGSALPTASETLSSTYTPTGSGTITASATATETTSPSATVSATPTESSSSTMSYSATASAPETATSSATASATPTSSASATASATVTAVGTMEPTSAPPSPDSSSNPDPAVTPSPSALSASAAATVNPVPDGSSVCPMVARVVQNVTLVNVNAGLLGQMGCCVYWSLEWMAQMSGGQIRLADWSVYSPGNDSTVYTSASAIDISMCWCPKCAGNLPLPSNQTAGVSRTVSVFISVTLAATVPSCDEFLVTANTFTTYLAQQSASRLLCSLRVAAAQMKLPSAAIDVEVGNTDVDFSNPPVIGDGGSSVLLKVGLALAVITVVLGSVACYLCRDRARPPTVAQSLRLARTVKGDMLTVNDVSKTRAAIRQYRCSYGCTSVDSRGAQLPQLVPTLSIGELLQDEILNVVQADLSSGKTATKTGASSTSSLVTVAAPTASKGHTKNTVVDSLAQSVAPLVGRDVAKSFLQEAIALALNVAKSVVIDGGRDNQPGLLNPLNNAVEVQGTDPELVRLQKLKGADNTRKAPPTVIKLQDAHIEWVLEGSKRAVGQAAVCAAVATVKCIADMNIPHTASSNLEAVGMNAVRAARAVEAANVAMTRRGLGWLCWLSPLGEAAGNDKRRVALPRSPSQKDTGLNSNLQWSPNNASQVPGLMPTDGSSGVADGGPRTTRVHGGHRPSNVGIGIPLIRTRSRMPGLVLPVARPLSAFDTPEVELKMFASQKIAKQKSFERSQQAPR